MSFFLVCPELEFTLELQLTASAEEQMHRQIMRVQDEGDLTRFELRLAAELGKVLPEAVDWDIKSPTRAQLALAQSLARQMSHPISDLARSSRFEMHQFIAILSELKKVTAADPRKASGRRDTAKRKKTNAI
ncbi:hypothetical protein [Stenotrophomonas sp. TWI809]|uniref:hypothetical protein n=1 Tax=Stenotrophomonas sp. TWI809 TaxID=3136796 RepID=UPI003207AE88